MTKINSSFFGNFSTKSDEELDNEVEVKSKKNDSDVEEVEVDDSEASKMEYADEDETEEVVTDKDEEGDESIESETGEDEADDPFVATINHLAEAGLITYDEDKEYEEEGEALLEVVFQETLEKRFQSEYVDTIPEEFQSIFKHLQAGRPLDEWVEAVKPTDFDSINMDDESNQKQLVEDHLILTGMDEEDIKDRLQELEDLGTLEKAAKTAIKYLKKSEEGKVKAYEQELERSITLQKEQEEKQFEDFKKTVLTTEKLKDFDLPKAKREKLLNHVTKPVNKNGESQYVINQKSIENQLLLAYLDMEGYSMKDIKRAVETKVTSGLRKSLSHFSDTNAKGSKGSSVRATTESKKIPSGPWAGSIEIED